jgi:hypothetical protein
VVAASRSTVYTAKGTLGPYFNVYMQKITPFLSLRAKGKEQEQWGVAPHTIGELASAVGKVKNSSCSWNDVSPILFGLSI